MPREAAPVAMRRGWRTGISARSASPTAGPALGRRRRRATCASPTKRPTSPAVGRNAPETDAKSGKAWTPPGWSDWQESPANQLHLKDRTARLKIVVSPVRVRVSPYEIAVVARFSSKRCVAGSFPIGTRLGHESSDRVRAHDAVPVVRPNHPVVRDEENTTPVRSPGPSRSFLDVSAPIAEA
jgi:hypothetical protein